MGIFSKKVAPIDVKAADLTALICAAAKAAGDGWATSLYLPPPFFGNHLGETVSIVSGVVRCAEAGELVRIYPYIDDRVPETLVVHNLVLATLPPFIEGIGKVIARQTKEGGIVVLRDEELVA